MRWSLCVLALLAGCDEEAWEPPPCADSERRNADLTVCSEVPGVLNLEFVHFEPPGPGTCAALRTDPSAWITLSIQRRFPFRLWQRFRNRIPLSRDVFACDVGMFLQGPAQAALVLVGSAEPEDVHAILNETEAGDFVWTYPNEQTSFRPID